MTSSVYSVQKTWLFKYTCFLLKDSKQLVVAFIVRSTLDDAHLQTQAQVIFWFKRMAMEVQRKTARRWPCKFKERLLEDGKEDHCSNGVRR